jgi:hypothetical protein
MIMTKISIAIRYGVSSLLAVGFVSAAQAESSAGVEGAVADVIAIGPLEFVDTNSVTVLGRSYRVSDTAALETGTKIAVHGDLQADGSVSNAWAEPIGTYVAGSDRVFETGVVTSVNDTFGRMSIGDSKVDYTAALAEQGASVPDKGDLVSVTGVQPEAGGVVLGTTTRAGTTEVVMAMAGGGTLGLAGITGSNRSTAGITGSNRATAGITGSNSVTSGITGSNRATAGITGSNSVTSGITGSNRATAGITGSNSVTSGITGSNRATAGITGSNRTTAGITGSNRYSR